MKKAIIAGLAIGLVVGTFESVRAKGASTTTWGAAIKSGLTNPTTLGAAAAAAVASFLL